MRSGKTNLNMADKGRFSNSADKQTMSVEYILGASSHQSRHRVSWGMCSRGPPAIATPGRGQRIDGWNARRSSPRTCSGAHVSRHTLRRLRRLLVVEIFKVADTEANNYAVMLLLLQTLTLNFWQCVSGVKGQRRENCQAYLNQEWHTSFNMLSKLNFSIP